jgi:hypothetical protein
VGFFAALLFSAAAAGPASSASTTIHANKMEQTFQVRFIVFLLSRCFFPVGRDVRDALPDSHMMLPVTGHWTLMYSSHAKIRFQSSAISATTAMNANSTENSFKV